MLDTKVPCEAILEAMDVVVAVLAPPARCCIGRVVDLEARNRRLGVRDSGAHVI